MSKKTILFLCTANFTRSPLAAAIMEDEAKKHGDDWINIISRGTSGKCKDDRPFRFLRLESQRMGYNIDSHICQKATSNEIEGADLIICLDRTHLRWILDNYYRAKDKACLLSEGVGIEVDFIDIAPSTREDVARIIANLGGFIRAGYDFFLERCGNASHNQNG